MKIKIFALLILLMNTAVLQVSSQPAIPSTVNPGEQKIASVKTFESKYIASKVYLHIKVNGNNETKMLAIERSLDETNYEVIGFIKLIGTDVQCDLSYYFTDESPVSSQLYYRLSDYSDYNEPCHSETICVIPIDKNTPASSTATTAHISNKGSASFVEDINLK
jgi:hypothetical protein